MKPKEQNIYIYLPMYNNNIVSRLHVTYYIVCTCGFSLVFFELILIRLFKYYSPYFEMKNLFSHDLL